MSDQFYSQNATYLSKKHKLIEDHKAVAARVAKAILKAASDYEQFGLVTTLDEDGCLRFDWHGQSYLGAFTLSFPPGKEERTKPTEAQLSVIPLTESDEEDETTPLFRAQFDSLGNVEQSYLPEDFAGFFFSQFIQKIDDQSQVFRLEIVQEESEDLSLGSPGPTRREFERGE